MKHPRVCVVPWCPRPRTSGLLCTMHNVRMARGADLLGPSKAPWFHGRADDAPCPSCGRRTFAAYSHLFYLYRRCGAGHSTVWVRDATGAPRFLRVALTHEDRRDPRPCDFPGCGRPRKDRYCQGHSKQRNRYGVAGLRPLLEPHERGELRRERIAERRAR